jgi:hypothetical protein
MTTCRYCHTNIRYVGDGVWLDETDGDACSGDADGEPAESGLVTDGRLVNENEPHVPGEWKSAVDVFEIELEEHTRFRTNRRRFLGI